MSGTFQKFMDGMKKIKHPAEMEFNATEFALNMLRRIEYSKDQVAQEHPSVVAVASTEMPSLYKNTDPTSLYFLIKNNIRYFTTAIDLMIIKADQLAEEQGAVVKKPNRLDRILYQKKLTRVSKRAYMAEGPYGAFVREESERKDDLPPSMVTICLNAYIFHTNVPSEYRLVLSAITRGLNYNPNNNSFKFVQNIETIF